MASKPSMYIYLIFFINKIKWFIRVMIATMPNYLCILYVTCKATITCGWQFFSVFIVYFA